MHEGSHASKCSTSRHTASTSPSLTPSTTSILSVIRPSSWRKRVCEPSTSMEPLHPESAQRAKGLYGRREAAAHGAAVAARDASSSDASLAALEFGSAAIASSTARSRLAAFRARHSSCSRQTSRNEGTISELRSVGYLGMSSPMVMAASDPFGFLWLWPFRSRRSALRADEAKRGSCARDVQLPTK